MSVQETLADGHKAQPAWHTVLRYVRNLTLVAVSVHFLYTYVTTYLDVEAIQRYNAAVAFVADGHCEPNTMYKYGFEELCHQRARHGRMMLQTYVLEVAARDMFEHFMSLGAIATAAVGLARYITGWCDVGSHCRDHIHGTIGSFVSTLWLTLPLIMVLMVIRAFYSPSTIPSHLRPWVQAAHRRFTGRQGQIYVDPEYSFNGVETIDSDLAMNAYATSPQQNWAHTHARQRQIPPPRSLMLDPYEYSKLSSNLSYKPSPYDRTSV
jgi:hypothetical protein